MGFSLKEIKIIKVTPLFKNGDPKKITSYPTSSNLLENYWEVFQVAVFESEVHFSEASIVTGVLSVGSIVNPLLEL